MLYGRNAKPIYFRKTKENNIVIHPAFHIAIRGNRTVIFLSLRFEESQI